MELEEADMVAGIRAGMKDRSVVPVFASSAMQNIGTEAFLQGVMDYVPAPIEMDGIDAAAPPRALSSRLFPTSTVSTAS